MSLAAKAGRISLFRSTSGRAQLQSLQALPKLLCYRQRPIGRSTHRTMVAVADTPPSTGRSFKDYEALCDKLKEISTLNGVNGLLMWDEMVMMPPGAAAVRAQQKSALTGIVYDKQTSSELGELLKRMDDLEDQLDPFQGAVVRESLREYVKATAVPKKLAKRRAELESEGYQAWVTARTQKDFSKFAPTLKEWIDITREQSACIDPSRPAYDVALQDFEKGFTSARLDEIFVQLREGLVPLIKEIRERGTAPDSSVLSGTFDSKTQADLCNRIAEELGFNLERGRLDVSVHPFTGGAHPTDVRMTTRFKEHDLTEGLTGAIHETGHALYEQGRNLEYDGLPVNEALSMGTHESQSLLWERMVALSPAFARYLTPLLRESFPQLPADLSPEQVYGAVNVVKFPSLIRVEADEIQYPLHIVLRYEIEKALVDGSLAVEDVPKVWNQKMSQYLGATPEDDAQGCLQDMHWSAGAFAYFPTYTLGALYACQIFKAAQKDLPTLNEDIAAGRFEGLRKWLNGKIHQQGSLYPSGDELMVAVTGSPLKPQIFLDYLKEKYSALYQL